MLYVWCNDGVGSNHASRIFMYNTDGSFTMANSNSFLCPYEILTLAQGNNNLGKFLIYHEIYYEIMVCTY